MPKRTRDKDRKFRFLWNPKPSKTNGNGGQTWYRYYAGFSEAFVADLVGDLQIRPGALVLDPWNGTGTTTRVACRAGAGAIGYDINPGLVVIAKGRALPAAQVRDYRRLTDLICTRAKRSPNQQPETDDSLAQWFANSTVLSIRHIERAIIGAQSSIVQQIDKKLRLAEFDPLTSAAYVALFKTVRKHLTHFVGSNPTWFASGGARKRLKPSLQTLLHDFQAFSEENAYYALLMNHMSTAQQAYERLFVGDSTDLELASESVDAVITSPPYCTRIDYAISTLPELAVLGLGRNDDVLELRRKLIGTPLTSQAISTPNDVLLGKKCTALLASISKHRSKASATYYLRFFSLYFSGLQKSIVEITRVLRPGGRAVFVVQDSYYKDIHVDLPDLLKEIATIAGLELLSQKDFPVRITMANVNSRSRRYGTTKSATESALFFLKKDSARA